MESYLRNNTRLIAILLLLGIAILNLLPFNASQSQKRYTNWGNDYPRNPRTANGEVVLVMNTSWGLPRGNSPMATALSPDGHIFVTGAVDNSSGGTGWDIALDCFNVTGTLLWNVSWGGTQMDKPTAVTVDRLGMVYVAGFTQSFGLGTPSAPNIFLIKFAPDGTKIWNLTWGDQRDDYALGLAINSQNRIYIAGMTNWFGAGNYDALVLEFNSTTQSVTWNTTFGSVGDDQGNAIGIDQNDDILLTGQWDQGARYNPFLVKYGKNHVQTWNRSWYSVDDTVGSAVTIDCNNEIIMTVWDPDLPGDAYITKYTSDGISSWNTTWAQSYNDHPTGIVTDSNGRIYVTLANSSSGAIPDAIIASFASNGTSLANFTWGGPFEDEFWAIAVDSQNNLFIVGKTMWFSGGADYQSMLARVALRGITSPPDVSLVVGSEGQTLSWTVTDPVPGTTNYHIYRDGYQTHDYFWESGVPFSSNLDNIAIGSHNYTVIATDEAGNTFTDEVIVSVSSNAQLQAWNSTWDWSPTDTVNSIIPDRAGGVYVGGTSNYNALLARFDGNGALLWKTSWGGAGSDSGSAVATDDLGMIYIDGGFINGSLLDIFLAKFAPDGTQVWNQTWGTIGRSEIARAIAVDGNNSIFIVGYSDWISIPSAAVLIKYAPNGTKLWNASWDGPLNDRFQGVTVTPDSHFIYACGETLSWTGGVYYDALFVKYYANGTRISNWTWGSGSTSEYANAIKVDKIGNVYAAGSTSSDALLLKYSQGASLLWSHIFGETTSSNEDFMSLALDSNGSVYVAGITNPPGGDPQYSMLLKYDAVKTLLWATEWNSTHDQNFLGVTVDSNGNVYVAGVIDVSTSNPNVILGKYFLNANASITKPDDIWMAGGTPTLISWRPIDTLVVDPTYTIYRNETPHGLQGTWTSGSPITLDVSGFPGGSYNITIVLNDGFDGITTDEVIVHVLNTLPSITGSQDLSFETGTTGHSINWTLYDVTLYNPTYTIYLNGSVNITQTGWFYGTKVSVTVDHFPVGIYSYTIVISDGLGATVADEVIVTVLPSSTSGLDAIFAIATILGVVGIVVVLAVPYIATYIKVRHPETTARISAKIHNLRTKIRRKTT